jgi:hypothetical protein
VVAAAFESPGDDSIFAKARADLAAKSIEISDHLLKKHLLEFRDVAMQQLKTE